MTTETFDKLVTWDEILDDTVTLKCHIKTVFKNSSSTPYYYYEQCGKCMERYEQLKARAIKAGIITQEEMDTLEVYGINKPFQRFIPPYQKRWEAQESINNHNFRILTNARDFKKQGTNTAWLFRNIIESPILIVSIPCAIVFGEVVLPFLIGGILLHLIDGLFTLFQRAQIDRTYDKLLSDNSAEHLRVRAQLKTEISNNPKDNFKQRFFKMKTKLLESSVMSDMWREKIKVSPNKSSL